MVKRFVLSNNKLVNNILFHEIYVYIFNRNKVLNLVITNQSASTTVAMDRAKSDMNLGQLTEDERQAILRVLKRDQALRNMEEKRLIYMKSELHMLKKRGALKPGLNSSCNGSRCARCLTPLGLLINTGADCFVCLKKVCRSCRQYNELAPTNTNPKQWACLVCSKQM